MDGLDELLNAAEARVVQRFALKDAEPDLHLIEPTRAGGCEMEGDIRMRGKPGVVPLVGVQVVQDDVDLPPGGLIRNDLLHEGLKVGAFLGLRGLAANDAGGDFQGGEQVDGAVTPVGALHPLDDLPAAGLDVAAGSFERLDRGFLVDAEHQGIVRRVQVQANHVGGLGGKLGVRADAPGAVALQLDAFFAQHAPHRIIRHVQRQRQGATVPTRPAHGRRHLQLRQDSIAQLNAVLRGLAGPGLIAKPGNTARSKAPAPLPHRIGSNTDLARNLGVALALQTRQHNARALGYADLAAAASRQTLKLGHDFCRARQCHRDSCHEAPIDRAMRTS